MMKRIFFIFGLSLILCFEAYGQLTTAAYAMATRQIKLGAPNIDKQVLDDDFEKINRRFDAIKKALKKERYNDEEIDEAILAGWVYVRLYSPLKKSSQSIDESSFEEFMISKFFRSMGKVIFKSDPENGAEIFVGGTPIGNSETSGWYTVNLTLTVVCKKPGYNDGISSCTVSLGNNDCVCRLGR